MKWCLIRRGNRGFLNPWFLTGFPAGWTIDPGLATLFKSRKAAKRCRDLWIDEYPDVMILPTMGWGQ